MGKRDAQGRRVCEGCGELLDSCDSCMFCRAAGKPCGLHRRLRRSPKARFCCRACREGRKRAS